MIFFHIRTAKYPSWISFGHHSTNRRSWQLTRHQLFRRPRAPRRQATTYSTLCYYEEEVHSSRLDNNLVRILFVIVVSLSDIASSCSYSNLCASTGAKWITKAQLDSLLHAGIISMSLLKGYVICTLLPHGSFWPQTEFLWWSLQTRQGYWLLLPLTLSGRTQCYCIALHSRSTRDDSRTTNHACFVLAVLLYLHDFFVFTQGYLCA